MDITRKVAEMRFKYHLNAIDINNVLNQLGIRSDERAEKKAEYHVMTIFSDILPRLGYDISSLKKK